MTDYGVVVELQQASRSYRVGEEPVLALDRVDLTIPAATSWAILGASGSGKSTLLNILGCLERLSSGRYLLRGQDVNDLEDNALSLLRLKSFGFIFQSFHLIPQLTVVENIELPLFYAQWDATLARQRATQLAQQVGLEDRLLHRPTQLSGGQQQRVAIARALANDAPLILADEPTGNLDSATGDQIMQLLLRLPEQGKTLIMVTHDRQLAADVQHRLFLHDGRVLRIEGAAHVPI